MKKCLLLIVFLTVLASLASAGSTKLVSTWKNPKAVPVERASQKVAVFVVAKEQTMRLGTEEAMAAEMRKQGLNCVAGYTVLPAEVAGDKEKGKEILKKAGFTMAIMVRVLGNDKDIYTTQGTVVYTGASYSSFYGYWDYSWSAAYMPAYLITDTIVTLETIIYSIGQDQPLWAGQSKTKNPKDIDHIIKDLRKIVSNELKKSGLIKK